MKKLLSATFLLIACHAVLAGDAKPDATGSKAAAPAASASKAGPVVDVKPAATVTGTNAGTDADTGAYVPKTKSVFTATANDHNPFWPIGWVKSEAISSGDEAPINPHCEDFNVTTIMLNDPPMAVINGKDMALGEVAALSVNGRTVMVQLMDVQDGKVVLRWQNQNLVVPLHRDETLSSTTEVQPDNQNGSQPLAVGGQ